MINNKPLYLTILSMLSFLVVSLIVIIIMALWPYEPMRIDKFLVDKTEVCRGGVVTFQFVGEKMTDVSPDISVDFVDGEAIPLMTYAGANPKGTLLKARSFVVPFHSKVNQDYQIRWTAKYPMNIFNKVTITKLSPFVKVLDCQPQRGIQGKQGVPGKNFWGK
jgi:hypothetical protein